ncbi:unnamed protein product [Diplocarpon coronariae]
MTKPSATPVPSPAQERLGVARSPVALAPRLGRWNVGSRILESSVAGPWRGAFLAVEERGMWMWTYMCRYTALYGSVKLSARVDKRVPHEICKPLLSWPRLRGLSLPRWRGWSPLGRRGAGEGCDRSHAPPSESVAPAPARADAGCGMRMQMRDADADAETGPSRR